VGAIGHVVDPLAEEGAPAVKIDALDDGSELTDHFALGRQRQGDVRARRVLLELPAPGLDFARLEGHVNRAKNAVKAIQNGHFVAGAILANLDGSELGIHAVRGQGTGTSCDGVPFGAGARRAKSIGA
jgi:hypothetical protein